jgi:hypothetical protein
MRILAKTFVNPASVQFQKRIKMESLIELIVIPSISSLEGAKSGCHLKSYPFPQQKNM